LITPSAFFRVNQAWLAPSASRTVRGRGPRLLETTRVFGIGETEDSPKYGAAAVQICCALPMNPLRAEAAAEAGAMQSANARTDASIMFRKPITRAALPTTVYALFDRRLRSVSTPVARPALYGIAEGGGVGARRGGMRRRGL
jgi:hypothetical protein